MLVRRSLVPSFLGKRGFSTSTVDSKPVDLSFSRVPAEKPATTASPLVILHGLFGSKQNWKALSKAFARRLNTDVYTLDLRNHGESPHARPYTYSAMSDDVAAFLQKHSIDNATVMGHSMGGKVAMTLALRKTPQVQNLIVVDMAPTVMSLSLDFASYVKAMNKIEAAKVAKQSQADEILRDFESDLGIRQFLLTNLKRPAHSDHYSFRIPLDILGDALGEMGQFPFQSSHHTFRGPTLFIAGGNSGYVKPEKNGELIHSFFPNSTIKVIDGAGHWVHAEKPEEFGQLVTQFYKSLQ